MTAFLNHITQTLAHIDAEGMMKRERLISSPPVSYTHLTLPTILLV